MSKPTKAQLAKRAARALDLQQRKEALSTLGYPEAGGSRGAFVVYRTRPWPTRIT
jgi:hypothetical protein